MIGASYLEVWTFKGWFELALAPDPLFPPLPAFARRTATPEEADEAWFFFECEMEYPDYSQLDEVLDLYAELTGERPVLRGNTRDVPIVEQVVEEFKRALWTGELVFEKMWEPEPMSHHIEYIQDPDPSPEPMAPVKDVADVYFDVKLVDEVGAPISGQDVFFSHAGDRAARSRDPPGESCGAPSLGDHAAAFATG